MYKIYSFRQALQSSSITVKFNLIIAVLLYSLLFGCSKEPSAPDEGNTQNKIELAGGMFKDNTSLSFEVYETTAFYMSDYGILMVGMLKLGYTINDKSCDIAVFIPIKDNTGNFKWTDEVLGVMVLIDFDDGSEFIYSGTDGHTEIKKFDFGKNGIRGTFSGNLINDKDSVDKVHIPSGSFSTQLYLSSSKSKDDIIQSSYLISIANKLYKNKL